MAPGHPAYLSNQTADAPPTTDSPPLSVSSPQMSNKSTFKGTPPKYINDFSKALASEVRILLHEVGKLRDERRALQFEIAELMAVKSKHGAGGEYAPDWKPKSDSPPVDAPASGDAEPAKPLTAKPAWRTVHRKPLAHRPTPKPPSPPAQPAAHSPDEAARTIPSWTTWKPNPMFAPTPKPAVATAPLPPPTPPAPRGLFGDDG